MDYCSKRVLILDAYCRQTLPMVRGFKEVGCEVTVLCFSRLDVGYASKYPDHKILLSCSKEDSIAQAEIVRCLLEKHEFDLVVPMNDRGATILANNKAYLSQFAYIAVNDPEVFSLAINKENTMRVCAEHHIPSPLTYFSAAPEAASSSNSSFSFPLVVKPKTACGSIGFNIARDSRHLQKILHEQSARNGPLLLQDYIPQAGPQYGAEAFRHRDGSYGFVLINKKPRWFPLDGGSPTINISIHEKNMERMAKALLDAMEWVGYANIDFVVDSRDHQPKILEVNGRISAAVALDEAVGINVAKLICEEAFGAPASRYDHYPDDVRVSCILTEFLWFLKSQERFKSDPSIFSRKGTTDVIFSWKDPKPFLVFCLQSVANYKHAMKQRTRS